MVTALQILFSLIRYVTETIRSVSVLFSDSEDEPDDEASSSDKDVSDATLPARTTYSIVIFLAGSGQERQKRDAFYQSKGDFVSRHAPTARLPRNRKGGPGGYRASRVGV